MSTTALKFARLRESSFAIRSIPASVRFFRPPAAKDVSCRVDDLVPLGVDAGTVLALLQPSLPLGLELRVLEGGNGGVQSRRASGRDRASEPPVSAVAAWLSCTARSFVSCAVVRRTAFTRLGRGWVTVGGGVDLMNRRWRARSSAADDGSFRKLGRVLPDGREAWNTREFVGTDLDEVVRRGHAVLLASTFPDDSWRGSSEEWRPLALSSS